MFNKLSKEKKKKRLLNKLWQTTCVGISERHLTRRKTSASLMNSFFSFATNLFVADELMRPVVTGVFVL